MFYGKKFTISKIINVGWESKKDVLIISKNSQQWK